MCDDQANDFIVRIRDDHAEINSYLTGNEVVSLKLTLDDVFKKIYCLVLPVILKYRYARSY